MRVDMRFVLAVLILLSAACQGGGQNGGGPSNGNPAVYERIAADTSCASLQAEFDQAAANHDRELEAGDLEAARWSTGYMTAANDRMQAIGCYN